MRISISLTNYSWCDAAPGLPSQLARVVRAADAAGLDTVWVPDHLIQAAPGSTLEEPMLEAYTTLGFLAAQPVTVRLGTMVSAATYRSPALLVKAVTTVDVLSGGRAWLGIGAGYHEDEARWMGLFLPPPAERFERLEDTLRLALQMWKGDDAPFEGARERLERPINSPQASTRPHPPILIGGMGERKTLRLVARYADACNLFDIPDGGATITRKLAVLAEHCSTVGRRYEDIEKTVSTRLEAGESVASVVGRCRALSALGIQHAVVITAGPWTDEGLATLAAAIPELARE